MLYVTGGLLPDVCALPFIARKTAFDSYNNKSKSTAGAVQVWANQQEQLSDPLHFIEERAAETLTYDEMQRDSVYHT